MINYYSFLILLFLALSCSSPKTNQQELVSQYYEAFNSSNYNAIKALITDSLTITEGEYIMNFTPESFHEHFKWDSIFQPSYEVIALEKQDNQVIATVTARSKRFEFLKNNPLTCQHLFSFRSGKISQLDNLDCPNADWTVWQQEVDSLVRWISEYLPELDGFIHDLSMQGALDYLKAIELYEAKSTNP